jgi:predicted nuclease of predicted toxin-antitoxin system
MKFFIDNNLSEHLANGMKAFGEDVIHLREKFSENTELAIL